MSLSMLARPLSKFSPRVSSVRLSTCGLVSAKFDGLIASTKLRVAKRNFSRIVRVDAVDLVDRAEQLVRYPQIGLADGVEDRVLAPFGRGEAAVLALGFAAGGAAVTPPSILPQVSSPLAQACAPARHQRHRVARAAVLAEAERAAATKPGNGWSFFRLSAQIFHQHLLGAAHHQRPMLPVLERRDRARSFRVVGHAANVGAMPVSPQIPPALVLPRLFRDRACSRFPARCSPPRSGRRSSPSSSSRSSPASAAAPCATC